MWYKWYPTSDYMCHVCLVFIRTTETVHSCWFQYVLFLFKTEARKHNRNTNYSLCPVRKYDMHNMHIMQKSYKKLKLNIKKHNTIFV